MKWRILVNTIYIFPERLNEYINVVTIFGTEMFDSFEGKALVTEICGIPSSHLFDHV